MFPLGTVLLPRAHLPLHIFEERYRALARDCLAGDRSFGVVLIERGQEVGGGDVRFSVGTVARITQAVELPDGRWLLDAVGTERIRILDWLPDEPYPRAEVETLADDPAGPEAEDLRAGVERLLRQVLALEVELGYPAPAATVTIDADPGRAAFEAALLSPIGPMDTQRLLELCRPEDRLRAVRDCLEDVRDTLARRIAEG
ncbi:MAG TPA: LON peptidase substrate-binding domain-containing protein [Acidimicrobiia bacterium]|nr:LON peptidase substrate-binding domain-containing protein [Acidimicrobiia bacterium]